MTPKPSTTYPHLHRLFAAYVNQDWDTYGPVPEDAVAAYVRDATKAERAATVVEIRALLAASPATKVLDVVLDELHCGYDPRAHGVSTARWLARIAALLERPPKA